MRARDRTPRPSLRRQFGQLGSAAKPLRIVTDCSGMEAPIFAIMSLGLIHEHVAASDSNKTVKKFWMAHNDPSKTYWYDDITTRNHNSLPELFGDVHMYVAGFPCQPFSRNGKNAGEADEWGRGTIVWHCIKTIKSIKPDSFILENVEGMVSSHPDTLTEIIRQLKKIGLYEIHAKILNAKFSGTPQNRPRLYIVGLKKSMLSGDFQCFQWPDDYNAPDLTHTLSPNEHCPKQLRKMLPASTARHARKTLCSCMETILTSGLNPLVDDCVCDIDSSGAHWMHNMSPCLTHARARGHWVTSRGRRQNIEERLRLMGMNPNEVTRNIITDRQLGQLIGNSMSVNVLERIFINVFASTNMVAKNRMPQHWESKAAATQRLHSYYLHSM